jgi:ribosomal protein S27AE
MTTEVEQVQATKWCSRCFFEKPINEFSLNNGKKDGHQTYCKLCKSILNKDYKTKNADKLKEYQLKYYSENAQKLAIKNRFRALEYRKIVNLDPIKKERLAEQRRISAGNHFHKFPEKIAARKAVFKAINSGVLVRPDVCSECGKMDEIQAHHDSYAPEHRLNVRWLCKKCHSTYHRKYPDLDR